MRARLLLAACCGLLLALAFEPVAWPVLLLPAVAGFVLCTRGLRARRAALVGLVFGALFYGAHTVWMRSVGVDAWLGMSAFMTLYYAATGALSALLQRLPGWPVLVAAAWTALEVLRSTWPFSGMPWGNLAFATVDTPASALLPWVGSVTLSFLLALAGSLLAALALALASTRAPAPASVPTRRRAWAVPAAGLLVLAAATGAGVVAPWQPRVEGTVDLAVVQGDVPGPRGDNILYDFRQVTDNHVQATVDLAARVESGLTPRPDLVLWPENSTAVDPFADARTRAGIETAVAAIAAPVLVGAIVDGPPGHVLNQGIVWDPETGAGDRYTKRHPVVFGEYIPFRTWLDDLQIGRLTMVGRDMLRGTRTSPLDVGGVLVADAICFDIAYDDGLQDQVARGAQLVTVQTSNATFVNTRQIDQQFAITRLRALETGRWVAVASTNGLSGIIDPTGTPVATAARRTTDVMTAPVQLVANTTPAMRVGPWPGRLAGLVTLGGLVAAAVSYRRRRAVHRTPGATAPTPTGGSPDGAGTTASGRTPHPAPDPTPVGEPA